MTLGPRTGAITAGTAGSATFTVTTANIANGTAGKLHLVHRLPRENPRIRAGRNRPVGDGSQQQCVDSDHGGNDLCGGRVVLLHGDLGSTSSAVATMTVASPPLTVYTGGCNGSAYGYWYGTSGSTPSWVSCPSGNENVNSIAVSGSTVYVGGVAAAGRGYWYGTAGSTPTWVSCPSGSEDINSIAVSGSTVYITGSNGSAAGYWYGVGGSTPPGSPAPAAAPVASIRSRSRTLQSI